METTTVTDTKRMPERTARTQTGTTSPILFFLGVLILGLVYEVKKGALQWEK